VACLAHVLLLLLLLRHTHSTHSMLHLLLLRVLLLLLLKLRRIRLVLLLLGWCSVHWRLLLLLPARHHGPDTRRTRGWQQLQLTAKHTHLLPLLLLLLLWLEHQATEHVGALHPSTACRQYTHRLYSCRRYSPRQYTLHARCTSTIHVRLLLLLLVLLLLLEEGSRHVLVPWLHARSFLYTSCTVAHVLLLLVLLWVLLLLPGQYTGLLLCGLLCKPTPRCCCCCCWWWWWYLKHPTSLQAP
jgi:hypothetical protein